MKRAQQFSWFCLGTALAIYFFLALHRPDHPGLQHDELFFANAALGGLDRTFIYQQWGPLPVYLMPYIGALKAWIYWPIFKLLGVSVLTVRLPALLLGGLGITLVHRLAWMLGGPIAAAGTVLLLALQPLIVWGIKLEVGPLVLEFVLQALGAILFFSGAGAAPLALVTALGLFNKISFLWWVVGVVGAGWFFYPARRRVLLAMAGTTGAFLGLWLLFFRYVNVGGEAGAFHLSDRWDYVYPVGGGVLQGTSVHTLVLAPYTGWLVSTHLWLALVALGLFYLAIFHRKHPSTKPALFLAAQIFITFLCVFFTARATAYWHFWHLLVWLLMLTTLVFRRLPYFFGLLFFAGLLAQFGLVTTAYLRAENQAPQDAHWSMAIYPLIDWCRAEERTCVSLDWGTNPTLLAFTGRPARTWDFDVRPDLLSEAYYIAYRDKHAGREKLATELRGTDWEMVLAHTVREEGKAIFDLYQLKKKKDEKKSSRPSIH